MQGYALFFGPMFVPAVVVLSQLNFKVKQAHVNWKITKKILISQFYYFVLKISLQVCKYVCMR